MKYLFLFFIFPGFLFSAAMGMIVGWVDRKVTARLQWRVGPPWYQNFIDCAKLLFYKETLLPRGASGAFFLGMPLVSAAAATLVSTIVLVINLSPGSGFIGDLIVVVYLMMIPPAALMLGAFASQNTLASLGASREMKLMLSYELPFILAIIVPVMKSGYSIKLGEIIMAQQGHIFIGSLSGALSFVVMLLCLQAKLGFIPFDMPEAETEIMAGAYIEYSGKALGIFKISKAIMSFAAPALLITLYFGGISASAEGIARAILQYCLILFIMIVIKNTNPRVRIDQAVRFFWGFVTFAAVSAAALAYFGL
jgi:NADH-quinone oxidoreductase subunit H